MNTKTDWIKMTDRRPTEADLPVWVFYKGAMRPILYTVEPPSYMTHWRPAAPDVPEPPMERTQYERDRDAFIHWDDGLSDNLAAAWHAAIAYERAEVAKMLPKAHPYPEGPWSAACRVIRARCAGGGK